MNGLAQTFDESYFDDQPSSTTSAKRQLVDRIRDTVNRKNWQEDLPAEPDGTPTSFKLEADSQIKAADTEINPEKNLRIKKRLVDWLEALSRVDDDSGPQEELLSEIRGLSVFQEGWDGEGAEAIAQESIKSAIYFIENYKTDLYFDAYPDPDGTIGIRADLPQGRVLLSFAKDGSVAYLIRKGKKVNRGHGEDHSTVNKLLETLL